MAQNCSGQRIRFQTCTNASMLGPWTAQREVVFAPEAALGYAPGRWDTISTYFDREATPPTLYGWWTASQASHGPCRHFVLPCRPVLCGESIGNIQGHMKMTSTADG